MKMRTKRLCLLTVAFFLFTSFALIFSATYKANAYTVPELSIVNGAYLRVVDTADSESAKASNGLRFVSYMDKQEYETLMAQSDITDVKFGILIAPDTATYILNENTVFSNDPTVKQYDWAIFNTETGNWDYFGDGTYKRIMNFSSDAMYENLEIGVESNVYFTGAIIGVKPENLAKEWQGVGYMSYVQNGQVKYQFTNKVVRSLVYTAQVAIANVSETAPSQTVKDWLQANYVDGATTVASSYKTEYYLEQKDGTFALNETVVTSDGVTIDDVATPAPAKEFAGYTFDESNANNVLGETKVLANGKTVFKRYYLLTEVGLVDKTNAQEVNSVRTLDGYTAVLNKVVGAKATPIEATFNGNVLDVSSLDGTYSLVLTNGDKTVTRTFDVYDSTQAPVWIDAPSVDNIWGYRTTAGDSKTETYRAKVGLMLDTEVVAETDHNGTYYFVGSRGIAGNGVYGAPVAINILPKHSKAYYEKYSNYVLSYEYYYTHSFSTYLAFENTETASTNRTAGWHETSVSMQALLDNWDYITDVATAKGAGYAMHALTMTWDKIEYYAYLGNFVLDLQELESTDEVQLINVKDMDGVNVDEIVDEEVYKVIESANSTWSLTAVHTNTVYALTDGAINFKSVPYGAYTLTATTEKGKDVYSLNVDLYNSDKPEYNDIVSTDYVWGYRPTVLDSWKKDQAQANNAVSIVTLDEIGHKGDYYAVDGASATVWNGTIIARNVLAKHSKAYYEMYADYSLTFEYYRGNKAAIYSYYVATGFDSDIETSATFGGDVYRGWYKEIMPMSTILEKWDAINNLVELPNDGKYDNAMLAANISGANYYLYFGNFKIEQIEVLPETPDETPAWNIVSDSVKDTHTWFANNGSATDSYRGGYRKTNVIELNESNYVAGKTSGKYYQTIALGFYDHTHDFVVKPYYDKSVYEAYYQANPNATLSFEFLFSMEGNTYGVRKAWIMGLTGTSYYTSFLTEDTWYTITVPFSWVINNIDDLVSSTMVAGNCRLFSLSPSTAYDSNNTSLGADTPTGICSFVGNFQINANGTVGVVKQA